jgi:hypothetical protein
MIPIKGWMKPVLAFAIGLYLGTFLDQPKTYGMFKSYNLHSEKSDILIGIFSTCSKFRKLFFDLYR